MVSYTQSEDFLHTFSHNCIVRFDIFSGLTQAEYVFVGFYAHVLCGIMKTRSGRLLSADGQSSADVPQRKLTGSQLSAQSKMERNVSTDVSQSTSTKSHGISTQRTGATDAHQDRSADSPLNRSAEVQQNRSADQQQNTSTRARSSHKGMKRKAYNADMREPKIKSRARVKADTQEETSDAKRIRKNSPKV